MKDPMDVVRALIGRWRIVAACLFVGLLGSLALFQQGSGHVHRTFQAEAVVVPSTNERGGRGASVSVLAVQATAPEVAQRAAATLKYKGDFNALRKLVGAKADPRAGTLTITVVG